ncbi:hypothetical protein HBZS_123160 [Helicobacter bizzozeronii CCUG 35545]|nr:hypothetical protein HBZS_123160 [Helicobacter bizzozeronii CCUG 35545]
MSGLKQFEMLHLFALMSGYINVERHRPPFAQVISDYLKVLDFIYHSRRKAPSFSYGDIRRMLFRV